MKANTTPDEMSLQEKAICLALTGRKPKPPYPLKGGGAHLPNPRHRQGEGACRPLPLR